VAGGPIPKPAPLLAPSRHDREDKKAVLATSVRLNRMGRLRSGVWRRLAYIPRFTRHSWHRRSWGLRRAVSGSRQRMRDYRDDADDERD
jgi:hypothetical protein